MGMTLEQAMARITELENAKKATITVKAADFGAGTVSVYGINRFPLSLHPAQWEVLEASLPAIKKYIAENGDKLRCAAYAAEFAAKLGKKYDAKDAVATDGFKGGLCARLYRSYGRQVVEVFQGSRVSSKVF